MAKTEFELDIVNVLKKHNLIGSEFKLKKVEIIMETNQEPQIKVDGVV